jgi:hypothetical protein
MNSRKFLGVASCAIGLVWIAQGVGALKGSFMTGQAIWAIIGGVLLLFGVSLLRGARRGDGGESG